MGETQEVTLFDPNGSPKGKIQVAYNNPSLIIGAQNFGAIRVRDIIEHVNIRSSKKEAQFLALLEGWKKESHELCVLFFTGDGRSGLSMCTKKETREGIVDGGSAPMDSILAQFNLYQHNYSNQPSEAVRELVAVVVRSFT